MELELGLKITQTKDDITSYSNIRITKDPSAPIFVSKETDTMFILIAHLKGFGKEQVGIKINEDGTKITINGERPVQEMVMSGGWMMQKKEVELRGFIKVFQIPDGVVLDKIKAKFNDQESNLKIYMPKLVKAIRGVRVEEVKETEMDKGQPEIAGTSSNQVPQTVEEGSEMQRAKTEEEVTRQDVKEGESMRKDIRENKIQSMQEIERKESDDDHGGKVQTNPQKAEGTHQKVKSEVPEITKTEEIHEVADVSLKEHLAKKATPQKVEPPAKTVTFQEASERAETSHPAEKEIQEEAEHIEENKTSVPEHA